MLNSTLIPFDHTYILYHADSPLSLTLALWSLFPILILVFIFSWFLLTREIEPCLFAAGQVINDIISGVCKKVVKYERPINGQIFKENGGLVWGMPSSHSQFMAFWSMYVILMYIWHNQPKKLFNPPQTRINNSNQLLMTVGCFVLMSCVSLVVFSRLYFEYHNINQVIVGLSMGWALGSGWFLTVCLLREFGFVDWVLQWKIADFLLMKDSFAYRSGPSLLDERLQWLEDRKK